MRINAILKRRLPIQPMGLDETENGGVIERNGNFWGFESEKCFSQMVSGLVGIADEEIGILGGAEGAESRGGKGGVVSTLERNCYGFRQGYK
ncbi:MAG: hypothetical protein C4527_29445 [Candidatus Omnitrophota bacterium]|jgi:hypothetical protein|nr:MAG: hypothetical protein C4527_29445 [Candidatus Omnitrophota bacterium]